MNKLALVTGGTRGIGKSISIALKNKGYDVVATYAANDEAAREFSKEYKIDVYRWDVSNFDECHQNIKNIIEAKGRTPQILVNNAGITRDKMLHNTTLDNWESVINTNLSSCFNMCHAIVPYMRKEAFGRIINISSINGQTGQLGQTNYSAAKAGMIGFSKSLAMENASKGITVNCIAPGYIETDMVAAIKPEIVEKIKEKIPVGRLGQPEDISRAVLFLADDNASFITGGVFPINGGQYM